MRFTMRPAMFSLACAALLTTGVGPESPFQTFSAFKTTVSYRFTCTRDVFTIAIEAVSQAAAGGESTLYWEISQAGQTALGGVQNVATLNTLQVQAAAGAPAEHDTALGVMMSVYRPCAGQSLYVWPASGATRLPNGDLDVRFSDAAEEPLS
jgi:hypothetical protein